MKKAFITPVLSPADVARLNALRRRPPTPDDDNPPLTPAQLARAIPHRGRPRGSQKGRLTIRIDQDVVAWLKRGGSGYQTRLNGILRRAMQRDTARK